MIRSKILRPILAALTIALLAACGGGGNNSPGTLAAEQPAASPSEVLLDQFGACRDVFEETAMRELLEFEDRSSPVQLLQLFNIEESTVLDQYDTQAAVVWEQFGARKRFASRIFAQMAGDRPFLEVRVIEFANIAMLIDAFTSEPFAEVMAILCEVATDQAWVIGVEQVLPIKPDGGFFDPRLQGLDESEARALLQARNEADQQDPELAGDAGTGVENLEAIIDMIVSDSPEPFFMVNLIDFREKAQYPDGRQTDLSGEEANSIYGQAILPRLFATNSGPVMLLPEPLVLTADPVAWEEAPIVRYASRDAFLNIFVLDPSAEDAIIHKWAGVENTLVYASNQLHDTPPEPVNGYLYNFRYCEILLPYFLDGGVVVDVWGTQGVNNCPQAAWDAIDPDAVAEEYGALAAVKNGVRFFVMDWGSNFGDLGGGEHRFFEDLEMARLTTVIPPDGAFDSGSAYGIARVARDNVWHYVSGRRIYELIDPEGNRYVMQSYSQIVDKDLSLEELETLGERLDLPPGWSWETRELLEPLAVPAVDNIAEVVQDDLANTYQRVPG